MKKALAMVALMALGTCVSLGSMAPRSLAAAPGVQADPTQILPDGVALIVFDVQRTISSELWNTLGQEPRSKKFIDSLQSHLLDLGLKLSDLNTLAISLPASGFNNSSIVVTGAFNGDDVIGRLRSNPKVKLSTESYKNVQINRAQSNEGANHSDTFFAFLDAGVVTVGARGGVQATIDVRTGDKPGMTQNAKLMAAMSENVPSAIRFAFAPTSALMGNLQSSSLPLPDLSTVNMVFGTVSIGSAIDVSATVRNDTAEHAKAMANQFNGLLAMAKGFLGSSTDPKLAPIGEAVKTFTVTDSGADVKISGSVSKELLAKVIH
jgi:hypothetical protein